MSGSFLDQLLQVCSVRHPSIKMPASVPKPERERGPVLVIGATGLIGNFVAEAAVTAGLPTYLLCRRPGNTTTPSKNDRIKLLQERGAIVVEGCANDKECMTRLLKELKIEVVVSVIGGRNIVDQISLIEAIEGVKTVKRFLPSEFGNDVDRANPVEPAIRVYKEKRKVRRAVEAAGIPYTYICCNSLAGWPYHDCHRPSEASPPLDHFSIYGDGNTKAYFVVGSDIGRLSIEAAHDARTLGKSVHFRPACNFLSMNELASLWESKMARTLPRVTFTEEQLLSLAAENRMPESIVAALTHDVFINGCQVDFTIDEGSKDVEVCSLYPDIPFRTMDEFFQESAIKLNLPSPIN